MAALIVAPRRSEICFSYLISGGHYDNQQMSKIDACRAQRSSSDKFLAYLWFVDNSVTGFPRALANLIHTDNSRPTSGST